jgi:hypothetical protein
MFPAAGSRPKEVEEEEECTEAREEVEGRIAGKIC